MRRVLIALLLLLGLAGPSPAQDYIRYYPPASVSGLTGSGTTLTATVPLIIPDGTAAAPSLAFAGDTDAGLFLPTSSTICSANGSNTNRFCSTASGAWSTFYNFGSSYNSLDLILGREAAATLQLGLDAATATAQEIKGPDSTGSGTAGGNLTVSAGDGTSGNANGGTLILKGGDPAGSGTAGTVEVRNSTNPQTFCLYGTYTDASNYERVCLYYDGSGYFRLQGSTAGTGVARGLMLHGAGNVVTVGSTVFTPLLNDQTALGQSAAAFKEAFVARSIQGSKTKALTEGSPTTVATVAVPQTAGSNFAAGEVRYTVYASDGTDTQTLNGSAFFSAVNKAGTEACQLTDDQIGTEAASAGTLVCTVACAVGLTDVVGITFDCTSSLTQTSLNALVRFDMQQPNTLTFP